MIPYGLLPKTNRSLKHFVKENHQPGVFAWSSRSSQLAVNEIETETLFVLQGVVRTGSAKSLPPKILFENTVSQSQQGTQPTQMASETGEPHVLARR
jgi:hypothetical protein